MMGKESGSSISCRVDDIGQLTGQIHEWGTVVRAGMRSGLLRIMITPMPRCLRGTYQAYRPHIFVTKQMRED